MIVPNFLLYFLLALLTPWLMPRWPTIYRFLSCTVAAVASPIMFYVWDNPPFRRLACDITFLGTPLHLIDITPLGLAFAWAFSIAAFLIFIYSWHQKHVIDATCIPIYIGSALSCVLVGDLLSFFIALEIMTIVSALLIFRRQTATSLTHGLYYLFFQLFAGLCILIAILLYQNEGNASLLLLPFVQETSAWLFMMFGLSIKVALVPFHTWLVETYDEGDDISTLALSLFTTKTALYGILVLLPGMRIFLILGLITAFYQGAWSFWASSERRVGLHLVGAQLGLMVALSSLVSPVMVGVYAFNHILYDTLMFIALGYLWAHKSTPLVWGALAIAFLTMGGAPLTLGLFVKAQLGTALHVHEGMYVIFNLLVGGMLLSGFLLLRQIWPGEHNSSIPFHIRIALIGGMLVCIVPGIVMLPQVNLHAWVAQSLLIVATIGIFFLIRPLLSQYLGRKLTLSSSGWNMYTLYKMTIQQVFFEILALLTFLRIGRQVAATLWQRVILLLSDPELRFAVMEWRGLTVFLRGAIFILFIALFFCVLT